jgi:hypothetical protein
MRQRYPVVLAANGRWPDASQGINLKPFNWLLIDNKGANPVDVALSGNPAAGDKIDTLFTVSGGKVRVKNLGGPTNGGQDDPSNAWPQELHLVSTLGTTVVVELADHPIVDLTFPT